jgi:hypothetical protein
MQNVIKLAPLIWSLHTPWCHFISGFWRVSLAEYLLILRVYSHLLQVMRTSPRYTHRRYGHPQVAIRPQLSCHVTLGFSRHVVTVSVITSSYDIETGHSWMRWKGDAAAVILDLVLAPEGPWIILCDHDKVLHHLFRPTWPCIMSGLKTKLWAPTPGRPQP